MFQRILVIGSPGAGKSTFARRLKEILGLPLYYLDMLWHRPDRTEVSRGEFDAALEEILKRNEWLIDGNYQRTMERRLQSCDTVFLLDYPVEVCLAGAAARVGQKREEMPWVEESLDREFLRQIQAFPETTLPEIYRLLEVYAEGRQVIVFRSREEAEAYLNALTPNNT